LLTHGPGKGTAFVLFSSRSRFTNDTVLTVAVADALLHGEDYAQTFVDYVFAYPDAGYGGTFLAQALTGRLRPYNSWGNGSAMRVCPAGLPMPFSGRSFGDRTSGPGAPGPAPAGHRSRVFRALFGPFGFIRPNAGVDGFVSDGG
jgi:ADP-ribosylglycohydrolase